MKRLIIFLVFISILLTSCSTNNNQKQTTDSTKVIPAETKESTKTLDNGKSDIDESTMPLVNDDNENCIIRLGLTRTEVKSKLSELKVPIIKEKEGLDDNYKPNGFWFIITKDFELVFNVNNQLSRISVNTNSDITTTKGLKKGDTLERMHKLYGEENSYDKGWNMYVYKMKNCNFGVIYNFGSTNNTVDSWTIFDGNIR